MASASVSARWQSSAYLRAIADLNDLPDAGSEVAFAGRSNAGKSSTLNRLCGQKALARTSRTPGRTQLIHLFSFGESARLADLPGYGFAKAPKAVQRSWGKLVQGYFESHRALRGVVVIMDVRRPLTPLDQQMVEWGGADGLPVLCLLNKADKLSRGAGMRALDLCRRDLKQLSVEAEVELFSAHSGLNVDAVRSRIAQWLLPPE